MHHLLLNYYNYKKVFATFIILPVKLSISKSSKIVLLNLNNDSLLLGVLTNTPGLSSNVSTIIFTSFAIAGTGCLLEILLFEVS